MNLAWFRDHRPTNLNERGITLKNTLGFEGIGCFWLIEILCVLFAQKHQN